MAGMPEADGVIAAQYRIDAARPGPVLQGGLRGFVVSDRRDASLNLMAVMTRPDLPPRPKISLAQNGIAVPYTVLPVDYGPGRDLAGLAGWFVVFEALDGAPVGISRQRWRDQELITGILHPAAAALEALEARGLTHRAINPDNLFRAGARGPATLGPFWAAPPASLQPAIFEPPYMARCLPTARGEGAIADDVYALGVTLLCLVLGQLPLAGLSDADILHRKIERGSYAALTADAPLTPLLADLLKGMLAEDPDHRPSPAMLLRTEQARTRRVAARPPRRAPVPLTIGGETAWSARDLAYAMGRHPEPAYALLKSGEAEKWLRRQLGDPQLGMELEEVVRRASESGQTESQDRCLLVMRGVAAIDPRAPLVWRGFALQPDGIGPALVGAPPDLAAAIEEIVAAQAIGALLAIHIKRADQASLIEEQRIWASWLAATGPGGGLRRLAYGMNPMLACGSPLLAGHQVVRVADLLPALDAAAATADRSRPPIDPHIAAFLVARLDAALGSELAALKSFAGAEDRLAVLRLFGQLQTRLHPDPLPGLAGWLVSSGFATVGDYRNQKTRAELQARVDEAAAAGRINTILLLADNHAARRADREGAAATAQRVRQLRAALDSIAQNQTARADAALALGAEIVAGLGLLANLAAMIGLALA